MDLKGLTLRQVAERLAEVEPPREQPTETMVKRHVDGDNYPSPDYVRRYQVITERAVGPNDWHEIALKRREERQPSHPLPAAASS